MRASAATRGANNIHAFEILVGPYAVAHLRFSQRILEEKGALPNDGAHVYLTDTLEPPNASPPGHLPLIYKMLGEEHKRAQKVKAETPVLVCIGNPPYDRQARDAAESVAARKGGWVRFGDAHKDGAGILRDFITPLEAQGATVHAKNLYNDYVYFWRWALWKVFESKSGEDPRGIVSFITASSYLRGPGFAGMRKVMRETFDELWIINLEGDNLGARKTENVFAIQTPVAIAVGVRYGKATPTTPAKVHYGRITGTQQEKYETLNKIKSFSSVKWQDCPKGWSEPFLPLLSSQYVVWPRLTDIFPWQENGVQFKRTWPIAENASVLGDRWKALLSAKDRATAFHETEGREVKKTYRDLVDRNKRLPPISSLSASTPLPPPIRFAFRSLDRRLALLDGRLADRPRPELYQVFSKKQIFLTSLLTEVLGEGPAAIATDLVPDLHHFRGSFGGKHVVPLWRDAAGSIPNITHGILAVLTKAFAKQVAAEDLFAYAYAILSSLDYVKAFWEELETPGPRLPISKDATPFFACVAMGRQLLYLHTFGNRCVPKGRKTGEVPPGTARCKVAVPSAAAKYPTDFSYDCKAHELHVGDGVFDNVRPEVWDFSISGYEVVKSWLDSRMRDRSGRKSSPLDDIRPTQWTFDEELLDMLWVLDHTVDIQPRLNKMLAEIQSSSIFLASEFPSPTPTECDASKPEAKAMNHDLFLDAAS